MNIHSIRASRLSKYGLLIAVILGGVFSFGALLQASVFSANGGTLGAIPDHLGTCQVGPFTAKDVTFTVSGVTGTPTQIAVSMTFSPAHGWSGDITATLIAPSAAQHTLFGRTGSVTATGTGDSSDLAGPYVFSDAAGAPPSGGWWQEAAARASAEPLTSGTYRTTDSGGAGAVNPMPPTSMDAAFAGVANANGTWTLRLIDGCSGDTTSITAASLTLGAGAKQVDFDGDSKTDWSIARDIAGSIVWYTENAGGDSVRQWGTTATDTLVPADYDGDGKTDIAIWRSGAQGVFYILQSSNSTLRIVPWGTTGDDPTVVADYDGDGKADPAIYRCPPFGGGAGQCYFWVLRSTAGTLTVPWGFGVDGDYFAAPGDYDGDGKADFVVQTSAGGGAGIFHLLRSSDGGYEAIRWGFDSDFIIPGDYDGDGKTDFCVRRTVSGVREHWILLRTGGIRFVRWGITGDTSVPGDYDGDGKTDLAVWRASATPGQSAYWVLKSSDGGVIFKLFGANLDAATAAWQVH